MRHPVLIALTSLVAVSLLLPIAASAHTPYTEAQCQEYSSWIYIFARAKSGGQTFKTVQAYAMEIAGKLHEQGGFVKDSSDTLGLVGSVDIVFNRKTTAEETRAAALGSCRAVLMKKS